MRCAWRPAPTSNAARCKANWRPRSPAMGCRMRCSSTTARPGGDAGGSRWTRLGVWLLKLGVDVRHSRPYHPQSRGKNERFHRTLKAEVFALNRFRNLADVQRAFDAWRIVYNLERPHQALDQEVPASRYRASTRSMPDRLPEIEYDEDEIVRTVPTTKDYVRSEEHTSE